MAVWILRPTKWLIVIFCGRQRIKEKCEDGNNKIIRKDVENLKRNLHFEVKAYLLKKNYDNK